MDKLKILAATVAKFDAWANIHYTSGYASGGWCRHCMAQLRLDKSGMKFKPVEHRADCPVLLAEKVLTE